MAESEVEYPIIEPEEQKLLQLSAGIQKRFGLELLGIDMIIENSTGRYAVIDVNVFPGYDGIEEFVPAMLELIQSKLGTSLGISSDNNAVKLERASTFYHPRIREAVTDNHAEPVVKAAVQSVKAEAHLKLSNGSAANAPLYTCVGANVGPNCADPVVVCSTDNCFKLCHNGDDTNGTA